ncbi:hypothetical protein LguiB_017322 [Lonicera macranthoides]
MNSSSAESKRVNSSVVTVAEKGSSSSAKNSIILDLNAMNFFWNISEICGEENDNADLVPLWKFAALHSSRQALNSKLNKMQQQESTERREKIPTYDSKLDGVGNYRARVLLFSTLLEMEKRR